MHSSTYLKHTSEPLSNPLVTSTKQPRPPTGRTRSPLLPHLQPPLLVFTVRGGAGEVTMADDTVFSLARRGRGAHRGLAQHYSRSHLPASPLCPPSRLLGRSVYPPRTATALHAFTTNSFFLAGHSLDLPLFVFAAFSTFPQLPALLTIPTTLRLCTLASERIAGRRSAAQFSKVQARFRPLPPPLLPSRQPSAAFRLRKGRRTYHRAQSVPPPPATVGSHRSCALRSLHRDFVTLLRSD